MYSLTGTLIEACSCSVLCPCWIGEDPDLGDCRAIVAYHIDDGHVGGLDVSGPSFVSLTYIPGTSWPGTGRSWRSWTTTPRTSREALLAVFTGEKGGPLADFAQLIGKVKGVESVPIRHEVVAAWGRSRSPGSWNRRWSPIGARQVA